MLLWINAGMDCNVSRGLWGLHILGILNRLQLWIILHMALCLGNRGRRKWQPTPVFLPGKSHGRRSLVDYSPWGCKKSDTTERLHFTYFTHFILYHWRRKWQPTPVFLPGESQRTEEPGRPWSMRLQRVGHDWSDWPNDYALGNRTMLTICCRWKSETHFSGASSWVGSLSLISAFEKGDVPF